MTYIKKRTAPQVLQGLATVTTDNRDHWKKTLKKANSKYLK